MNDELNYDDYLQRINIQEVLKDAGYQFYRRDGLKYPSYIRIDSDGRKVRGDKFIVNSGGWGCFQPPEQKVYNIISFIKQHPDMFKDYRPGMDKNQLVNLVCHRLLNEPMPLREAKVVIPNRNIRPFNLSDYEISRYNPRNESSQRAFDGWFGPRGINHVTQSDFRDHFFLATKQREGAPSAYANLAFPLTIPGKEGCVGLEERGKVRRDGTSFKGKAEGSNGAEGLWIANLNGQPLERAEGVYWFESAYDAMAEYQLNGIDIPYDEATVYVSTGGNPTGMQIRGMLAATPNARHYVGFDKDLAGKQFFANFRKIADNMGVRKDHVIPNYPFGYYKDWNDVLLGKKTMTLTLVDDQDCDIDYDTKSIFDKVKVNDNDRINDRINDRENDNSQTAHRGFHR